MWRYSGPVRVSGRREAVAVHWMRASGILPGAVMRTKDDLKPHHRAAWKMAAVPQTERSLMFAIPCLTPRMVRNMVTMGLLICTDGFYTQVPGVQTPKHRPPKEALQAASVWAYAKRFA